MASNLPHRSTNQSLSDDEAVPETDPSDVLTHSLWAWLDFPNQCFPDLQPTSREVASLQACLWLSGELHHRDREGAKSSRQGV